LDYEALAWLLQDIADNGADAFYTGEVADDIVATVNISTDVLLFSRFNFFVSFK